MRRVLAAIFLALSALPGQAQPTQSPFDAAMADLQAIIDQGADSDRIYRHLTTTIRNARALGNPDPDMALFYAMLTDHVRNVEKNPVLALHLADEGLALIAGDPAHNEIAIILQVTRIYALADLGRLDEAAGIATLIGPDYARFMGEDTAAGLAQDAARWAQGDLSDFNSAATDLARAVMEDAYALFAQDAFARVIPLASTALLPMDANLPERDLRGINTEAELLIARALTALDRHRAAGNAYLRALGYMTATPWPGQGAPDWWGGPPEAPDIRAIAFQVLMGVATSAGHLQLVDMELAAVSQAAPLAGDADTRFTTLLRQARLASLAGNGAEVIALLKTARTTAQDSGQEVNAGIAGFYIAQVTAQAALRDTGGFDPAPLIAAAEDAVAAHRAHGVAGADFIHEAAASTLLVQPAQAGPALNYARRAMQARQAHLSQRSDSGFGLDTARRGARDVVELFLSAAHLQAAGGSSPGLSAADCPERTAFTGCVVALRTAPD